jgi:uncharacterized protein
MSKWRVAIVLGLVAAPFLCLAGYGSYQLWAQGWSSWSWMPMTASLALAYFLGWYWQSRNLLLQVTFTPEPHWTDRDKQGWRLIEARAKAANQIHPDQLVQFPFYTETAHGLALEIARFYHPNSKDPFASLTVPEILAVIELAAHDLAEMVDQYLPGGHLLTISDWMKAKSATDHYKTANTAYWAISAAMSPFTTAARYLASEVAASPLSRLQNNLLVWFYTAFLQRLGTYLIELNSGRLRVGATRYRQLVEANKKPAAARPPASDDEQTEEVPVEVAAQATHVTLTLLGQVKAGKSSLVNALLGSQRAATSVLPETSAITHYQLRSKSFPVAFDILDTIGYAHAGPRADQLQATCEAACKSDILLLVLHARDAARQADLELLQQLKRWFADRPELKMPRILGVLTHIDLLSPAMEWQPPYRWQEPVRVKEQQIGAAVQAAREALGDYLVGLAPVCTAEGKVYGIEEWLLPALVELLDETRAVAMLRCIKAEADSGKIRKVFQQLLAAGKQAACIVWTVAGKR